MDNSSIFSISLKIIFIAFFGLLTTACGGGGGSAPTPDKPKSTAGSIDVEYRASTVFDPAIREQFPTCVGIFGADLRARIDVSWRNGPSQISQMLAVGADKWTKRFNDVPVNNRVILWISDPNECAEDGGLARTARVISNVFANGVELTTVKDFGTAGLGFEFELDATGKVSN